MPKPLTPIHPGEVLSEEILKPLNMSVNQLAKALASRYCPIERNRAWPARDHGRHSLALGPVSGHHRRILDQPPEIL